MYTPIKRRKSKELKVGNISIGGDNPIRVQSMTTTKTEDVESTIKQIMELYESGCEIVRVAVPTRNHIPYLKQIVQEVNNIIPIVADIHFDYKIALMAIDVGVNKIRINPGNIGGTEKVREIISACKLNNIPIRIGVNSGSLERDLINKYKGVTSDALVESALRWLDFFDKEGYLNVIVSVKSAIVPQMIEAYRKLAQKTDVPLHLGVTEAGTPKSGIIKSAIGIGSLLYDGIGDTFRVSLTAEPVEEVRVAWEILKALGIRTRGIDIIACPTCGRTKIDLISLAQEVEKALENERIPIKVAVMGCEVNGPGEASMADVGIAAGKGQGVIFRKGKPIKRLKEEELLNGLIEEIKKIKEEMGYK
ncbi:MAG: flavodoxin-dependent (E)-4-hydroxy-3-methylbut-2-enyl-diphosphate synthase [candidate division WOR-3 bacterium]